jgi:hypothetical protein
MVLILTRPGSFRGLHPLAMRHPNYFGDLAMWWGFYVIAARITPITSAAPRVGRHHVNLPSRALE